MTANSPSDLISKMRLKKATRFFTEYISPAKLIFHPLGRALHDYNSIFL